MMYKINNTQKILLAIGVGVGVAYVYNRYNKNKKKSPLDSTGDTNIKKPLPDLPPKPTKNLAINDLSREEKEIFIIDNISSNEQEDSVGFEGTRFVYNPTIGKMYPIGTISVGQEPSYMDLEFDGVDGKKNMQPKKPAPRSISPVLQVENSLKDLSDEEINLIASLVNTMKNNSSITSVEQAIDEMGITNENLINIINKKLKKRLNDIKIMKKTPNWTTNWSKRKQKRRELSKAFFDKMGYEKSKLDELVAKKCRGRFTNKAEQKKCVERCAEFLRAKMKAKFDAELSTASVSEKDAINNIRQNSFEEQITNRSAGAIYGGIRWDGESNDDIENLVDKGLIK